MNLQFYSTFVLICHRYKFTAVKCQQDHHHDARGVVHLKPRCQNQRIEPIYCENQKRTKTETRISTALTHHHLFPICIKAEELDLEEDGHLQSGGDIFGSIWVIFEEKMCFFFEYLFRRRRRITYTWLIFEALGAQC